MDQTTFNEIVQQFKETEDNKKQALKMNALMIKQKEQKFLYSFKKTQSLSDVRSLSKTILTIFLGVLIRRSDEGKYPKDRKSTRLNSSHVAISYAVLCFKRKITDKRQLVY